MSTGSIRALSVVIASALAQWGSIAQADEKPLPTVAKVDLARYLGTWYELARLPMRFEKDCVGVTATYSKREDGALEVVNRCYKKWLDGEMKESHGRVKVVDTATNAKLKISFFGPFCGDYWILDLGESYEYAVVGEPGRDYLWILSRTPSLPEPKIQALLDRAKEQGFDVSKIYRTPQRIEAPAVAPQ